MEKKTTALSPLLVVSLSDSLFGRCVSLASAKGGRTVCFVRHHAPPPPQKKRKKKKKIGRSRKVLFLFFSHFFSVFSSLYHRTHHSHSYKIKKKWPRTRKAGKEKANRRPARPSACWTTTTRIRSRYQEATSFSFLTLSRLDDEKFSSRVLFFFFFDG